MVDLDEVVAKILRQHAVLPEARSLLVGVSGIDGSGKRDQWDGYALRVYRFRR